MLSLDILSLCFNTYVVHKKMLGFMMTLIGTFKIDISTVYSQQGKQDMTQKLGSMYKREDKLCGALIRL